MLWSITPVVGGGRWWWEHKIRISVLSLDLCCNTTGLCFLTESAFSLHSFLPPSSLSPFLIGRMFLREPSWFLIGRTFLREPSWKYSSKPKVFVGVQKASLNMFWEHSPYSTNIASDWLRADLSCGWRKIKIKVDDGVARFFTRFGGNLFICWLVGGVALSRRPRMR